MAKDAAEIEDKSMKRGGRLDTVDNPRVLCAASEQYAEPAYGFDSDVSVLELISPDKSP